MIFDVDIKALEKLKAQKENELINKRLSNLSSDEISGLKAEIKYLDGKIIRIRGKKERVSCDELVRVRKQIDNKAMVAFQNFNSKYTKIRDLENSVSRFLKVMDNFLDNAVKVK